MAPKQEKKSKPIIIKKKAAGVKKVKKTKKRKVKKVKRHRRGTSLKSSTSTRPTATTKTSSRSRLDAILKSKEKGGVGTTAAALPLSSSISSKTLRTTTTTTSTRTSHRPKVARNIKPKLATSKSNKAAAAAATTTTTTTTTTNNNISSSLSSSSSSLQPKLEFAPTSASKCRTCQIKIRKGVKRCAIVEYSERFQKDIYLWYHATNQCCPSPSTLVFLQQQQGPKLISMERMTQSIAKSKEKQQLLTKLQTLRNLFAHRLGGGGGNTIQPFRIFTNTTLEEITYRKPITMNELEQIHGIGPKKIQNFGSSVLTIIQQHIQQHQQQEQQKRDKRISHTATSSSTTTVSRPIQIQKRRRYIVIDDSDEDDNDEDDVAIVNAANKKDMNSDRDELDDDNDDVDIAVVESMTCEQLVQQKFDHAAANGYVISVD